MAIVGTRGKLGAGAQVRTDSAGVPSGLLGRSSVAATLSVSPRGAVLDANPKMLELLGASAPEVVGRSLQIDLLAKANDWPLWQQAAEDGHVPVELKLRRVNGGIIEVAGDIWCDPVSGSLIGLFMDATMQGQLREAVQRGARLEALGGLTTGIAHDINNLLTVLLGNLYLVAEEARSDPKLFKKIKTARDAAKRGSELTRRLLSFARREASEAGVIDPLAVVEELVPLLKRALGRGIDLDTRLESGAGTVRASAAELESAIVNLTINAKDAMQSGGAVAIGVSSKRLGAEEAGTYGIAAGEYVAVSVSDNGAGIAPDALERVFEPFYSTKTERGGTGLGMSMVRWFSEHAGGTVHLSSEVGLGTTVTMLLPRCAEHSTDTTCARTMPLFTLPAGTESIVVLAEDGDLSATMRQMLEVLGYVVRSSSEPAEMLAMLRDEHVDLVIVDVTAIGGTPVSSLLQKAAQVRPGVKALVAANGPEAAGESERPRSLLLKPFSLFDFATAVRRTLDGAANV